MIEQVDPFTGEILPGLRLGAPPPAVAAGIATVMRAVKRLGYDDRNQSGGYSFASIDKFMEYVGRLCADAGIFITLDEKSWKVETREGGGKATSWLTMDYDIFVVHESGAAWGPIRRSVIVLANGPQAFGSAQSYVLKMFQRGLFQVPTGDKDDPDLHSHAELPQAAPKAAQGTPKADPLPQVQPAGQAAPAASAGAPAGDRTTFLRGEFSRISAQIGAAPNQAVLDEIMMREEGTITEIG